MRKLITLIGVAALALAALYVPYADTQVVYSGSFKDSLYTNVSADDTDVAFIVRYVGATPTATDTVTIASDTITFKQDGVADTTLECPVVAPLGGIIDTSHADCNTLGEVVDTINGSADWEAVLLDGLRTDATGTTNLLVAAAADATGKDGLNVYFDTDAVTFVHSRALGPGRTFKWFMPAESVNGKTINNPYLGTYSILGSMTGTSTYGSGTSLLQVYAVVPTRGGETVTLMWSEAGGATTVAKTIGASTWPWGLVGKKDAKLIYRITNSAAAASVSSSAYGIFYTY